MESVLKLVPVIHGRSAVAAHIRELCLASHFDCISVDLPDCFSQALPEAVDTLPEIRAVITDSITDPLYYVPTDPGDAAIEAIRQARQHRIPCVFTGSPVLAPPRLLGPLPDETAIRSIGFDAYAAMCVLAQGDRALDGPQEQAARFCALRILETQSRYPRLLALVHLRHFTRVCYHLGREETFNMPQTAQAAPGVQTCTVNPDHLFFVLGEIPFCTGRMERKRQDPLSEPYDLQHSIKDLFVETRDEYARSRDEIIELPPARIQAALTYLRNLTVQSGRLMPNLFDIVTAAKGVGGSSYALKILKNARYYPYLSIENSNAYLHAGIDKVRFAGESASRRAINLLKDTQTTWVRLPLKHDPSLSRKKKYRYQWDPTGMCSHVPEDTRIESFNAHVRSKAQRVLVEDLVRTEKFSTSMRDGLDIRETLRNWHTGDIYVRELPPSRGELDTVVIIFDGLHDERYPHTATWYAEHQEESTLTFYATDPMADMIGPGIARSQYGGLSLLFPPRSVPNVFEFSDRSDFKSLAHQLTYGAMLFGASRNVAYVAAAKPDPAMRRLAAKLNKHLVWIPLSSFSNETLRRLRRFHILNGREVRSWAARFIGD